MKRVLIGLWVLASAALCGEELPSRTIQGIEFVRIPKGSFLLGTPSTVRDALEARGVWSPLYLCETPATRVEISESFWLSRFEITQKQWAEVSRSEELQTPSAFKGDDRPVDSVSWVDIQEFLGSLNATSAGTFRLPSEAEWEYACRAGSIGEYGAGPHGTAVLPGGLDAYAWSSSNSESQTHPVGRLQPNRWGLYDMHGNLWEWCADTFDGAFYPTLWPIDPINRSEGTEKVFRGGAWNLPPETLRAAFRGGNWPDFRSPFVGFRLALDAESERED